MHQGVIFADAFDWNPNTNQQSDLPKPVYEDGYDDYGNEAFVLYPTEQIVKGFCDFLESAKVAFGDGLGVELSDFKVELDPWKTGVIFSIGTRDVGSGEHEREEYQLSFEEMCNPFATGAERKRIIDEARAKKEQQLAEKREREAREAEKRNVATRRAMLEGLAKEFGVKLVPEEKQDD